jgi:SAM-dependent methyltransferase
LIAELPSSARILELGSGPGLLAETILERCSNVESYTLLDFSQHMLELSQQRLFRFPMCRFVEANFRRRDWHTLVSGEFTSIVAMQSVHEIRHRRHVPGLYREVAGLLAQSGLFAVCDGIPRDPSVLWQVNLCMTAGEQLEAFAGAGLPDARVEMVFEKLLIVARRSQ